MFQTWFSLDEVDYFLIWIDAFRWSCVNMVDKLTCFKIVMILFISGHDYYVYYFIKRSELFDKTW